MKNWVLKNFWNGYTLFEKLFMLVAVAMQIIVFIIAEMFSFGYPFSYFKRRGNEALTKKLQENVPLEEILNMDDVASFLPNESSESLA